MENRLNRFFVKFGDDLSGLRQNHFLPQQLKAGPLIHRPFNTSDSIDISFHHPIVLQGILIPFCTASISLNSSLSKDFNPPNLCLDRIINSTHLLIFPQALASIVLKICTSLRTILSSVILSNSVCR